MRRAEVAVIGAGINGLACAVTLLESGYTVAIYTHEPISSTASSVAAAIWMQYKAMPWELVCKWLNHSLDVYRILEKDPESGVNRMLYKEFYPGYTECSCWLSDVNHPCETISEEQIPSSYKSGYESSIHRIDSTILLPYLLNKFLSLGGKLNYQYITSFSNQELPHRIIINCTGAQGADLSEDPNSYPIRGQCILLEKIKGLDTIYLGFLDDENYIGIVPRVNDCWLGGTANINSWDAKIDQHTTRSILKNAAELVPEIATAKILDVKVGFRSGRSIVRLEKEHISEDRILIHNYGHGGSGFSLAFGCAKEILTMIR